MLIASDQFRIVVGLGKSGMSLVRHLARRGLPFAVVDTRANPPELATLKAEYPDVQVRCGELDVDFLCTASELLVSPGLAVSTPALQEAAARGVKLSGGQRQRIALARGILRAFPVLVLDEPTAGMGTEERWRMIDKVRELWEKQKITVVFIEHDMDIVFKIAPKIVVLCYGRILATGTPDVIRSNEAVIEAYLGSDDHAGVVA